MTTLATAPIVKSIQVDGSPADAFAAWLDFTAWWPLDTHAVFDGPSTVEVERREGGAITEISADGQRCGWGEISVYDPPARLVFSFGAWRAETTEVEVRFSATGDGRTTVDLEHRRWEALGEEAATVRANYVGGWDVVLGFFSADRAESTSAL